MTLTMPTMSTFGTVLAYCLTMYSEYETIRVLSGGLSLYYLRSIPLVHIDFLVAEILAFHQNVIRFV